MSNKVQVIFTFELQRHTEKTVSGGVNVMDLVRANVQIRGLDVSDKADGPHIVYMRILKENAPEIISFLNDKFKEAVRALGYEVHIHNIH